MRGKTMVCGMLLALAAIGGCKQQCFLSECDYQHYHEITAQNLDCVSGSSIPPEAGNVPAPTTVLDTDRPIRYMSMVEAIAMGLEHGNVGGTFGFAALAGAPQVDLALSFGANGVAGSDAIRVFALEPAITATGIEAALSKFDAHFTTSVSWSTTDQPISTATQTALAGVT